MKKRITVPDIYNKKNKEKIVVLTCYTAQMAKVLDNHVDILLVGDSLGMTIYGHSNTLSVTKRMMIDHGLSVSKNSSKALVVVDMPFGTYESDKVKAFDLAAEILSKTHASAVKVEGGTEIAETINFLVNRGIPVMGHIGLLPQTSKRFALKGKNFNEKKNILEDAKLLSDAGVFSIVIECVVENLAKKITKAVKVPTIGIGASKHCDGQILVTDDIVGLSNFRPRFVKQYSNIKKIIEKSVKRYCNDVKNKKFQTTKHVYKL